MIQQNLLQMIQAEKVEWKTLGEVGTLIRGNGLQKKDFTETGVPAIHYGQIYTHYGFETKKTISFVSAELANKLRKVDKGDVVITNTSENLEDVGKAVLYLGEQQAVTGGHATIFKPNYEIIEGKYFVYFTQSDWFASEKRKYAKGTKVIDVSATDMEKIKVPIPSLEIQQKIVKILDKMTELEATLEAELFQRRRQYEYYRNALLDFDNRGGGVIAKLYPNCLKDVVWKTLGEVAEYSTMRIKADSLDETSYVGVDNLLQNRGGKTLASYAPNTESLAGFVAGDILIGNIRPYLKKIWQADRAGGASGDVLIIHTIDKDVNPRYLYQVLADDKFFTYNMQHAKGAKMPRGSKAAIMQYSFPIPPLEIQAKIVAILDQFDTLTQSISQGLPREIALRRKQYEYYREQLLNFAPAA